MSKGLYKTFERSIHRVTSKGYFPVVRNMVSEQGYEVVLGCPKTTSSRVLLIGVSEDRSMSRRL